MQEGSIAATLQAKPAGGDPLQLQMQLGRRVPLEGEELRRWQESQRAQLVDPDPAAEPDLQPVVSELASRSASVYPAALLRAIAAEPPDADINFMGKGIDTIRGDW